MEALESHQLHAQKATRTTINSIDDAITGAKSSDQRREIIFQIFREASDVASSSGSFEDIKLLFDAISQEEKAILISSLSSTFSKLGPSYDLKQKLSILEKINCSPDNLKQMRNRLFEMEARERYDEMKEEGLLSSMEHSDFSNVCVAMAKTRLYKGLIAAQDGKNEDYMRAAASKVAEYAMAAGTMEASKEIGNLPPGIVRDEAIAEMVIWLSQTGSHNEAKPWINAIEDQVALSRAMEAVNTTKSSKQ